MRISGQVKVLCLPEDLICANNYGNLRVFSTVLDLHHGVDPAEKMTIKHPEFPGVFLTHMKVPFSLCSLISKMEDLSDSAPVTKQTNN